MARAPKALKSPISLGALALGACLCAAPALAGPPVVADAPPTLTDAAIQPLRDLNIAPRRIAEPLKTAKAAPYAFKAEDECPAIRSEIAQLDQALGPDVDSQGSVKRSLVKGLAVDALGGVVKVPFRGVVRRITGAEQRDRDRQNAMMAGVARRAFLKGVIAAKCPDTPYLSVARADVASPDRQQVAQAEAPIWRPAADPEGLERAAYDGPGRQP